MPVSLTTGEMFLTHRDAAMGALEMSRTYNTARRTTNRYGMFGSGWNSTFEKRIRLMPPFPSRTLELRLEDGTPVYYFDPERDGTYRQEVPYGVETTVETLASGYRLNYRGGGYETYGATGKIESTVEAGGIATTYTPDVSGRLWTVTRLGRSYTFAYSGDSTQPSTLSGPAGLIATYTYDAGQLKTVTYADGDGDGIADGKHTYNYVGGFLVSVQDLDGKTIETHEYWPDGKAKTSEIADGREKLTFTYANGLTTVTDALDHVTTYEWAKVRHIDRVKKVTGPCSSCGGGGSETQEWTYDADGWISAYKDGAGNVASFTYDPPTGDLLSESRTVNPWEPTPLVLTTSYTYYADGRVETRTGPNGSLTTYTYVPAGPETITETIDATHTRQHSFEYTPSLGQLWKITDPRSKVTELQYNAFGDLESSEDPLEHVTTFEYDLMGRLKKTRLPVTTPPNDSPTTTYDTLGRVSRVTQPNGSYWEYKYDGGGHRKSSRDPMGKVTTYTYDQWGRLETIVDPLQNTTRFGYDLMSNLTSLTDARLKVTTFEYDGYNRLRKVTYPGSRVEEFTHTGAGRVATRLDRKGVTTTYTYDGLNRLKRKTYSNGSPDVVYGYDAGADKGLLTSAQNAADTLTWDYDLASQMLSETSARNQSIVAYEYDPAGNRTALRLNGQAVTTSTYDDAGRLATIVRSGAGTFGFGYDDASRRTSLSYPNGVLTTYGHDPLSQPTSIEATRAGQIVVRTTYGYDDRGNRGAKTSSDATGAAVRNYYYDDLSRLTQVDAAFLPTCSEEHCDPPPMPVPIDGYTYDEVGNRKTARWLAGTWTYSDRNELESYGGIAFTYDLNGNVLTTSGSPGRTYLWSVENQLLGVVEGGLQVAFEYDPLDRRVGKAVVNDGGDIPGDTFIYDGEDILAVKQGTGQTLLHIHGPGIDEPLLTEGPDATRTFYHADALGSVVKLTDATGATVGSHVYAAFGSGIPSGYGYTGREWDADTQLYYYRARYYDPKIGRFLSEDPIGFTAGVNFYSYVNNNPVNHTDPWGLIADGSQKSSPPTPPSPVPPTPTPTPPKTKLPWPQKLFNLCTEEGGTFVYWDEVSKNVNPFLDTDKFRDFKDRFSKGCESSGSGRFAVCSRMNFFGAVGGWCCCCEKKKTACGGGNGGGA